MRLLHCSVFWLDDTQRISACPHRESYFIPSSYHQTNQQFSHELSPGFSDFFICVFGLSVWLVSVNRCHLKGSFICLVTSYFALIWHFMSLHSTHLLSLVPPPSAPFQGTVEEQPTANLTFHEWSLFGHSALSFCLLQVAEPFLNGNYNTRI